MSGNDKLWGDDDDDVIIGQRGDDTINGGNGNDILVGDMASTPAATLESSLLPTSLIVTRLFNGLPVNTDGIQLPAFPENGALIMTPMLVLPRELELPISSIESVGGWTHDKLKVFEDQVLPLSATWKYGALTSNTPMTFQPLVTFSGTVAQHPSTTPGNDVVNGDAGRDTIVGDNLWVYSHTYTSIAYVDEARKRALTAVELANNRLSILAHQTDTLKGWQLMSSPTISCPSISKSIGCDRVNGGSDVDLVVGDDLMLPSIAPLFTATEPVSGILDTYHTLRDIEWITMYLDLAVDMAQRSTITSLLSFYGGSGPQFAGTCDYSDVTIGRDTVRQGEDPGIIVGNHLVVASSTAHPYGNCLAIPFNLALVRRLILDILMCCDTTVVSFASSTHLAAARRLRNSYYNVARATMQLQTPTAVSMSTLGVIPSIPCSTLVVARWIFGGDTMYSAGPESTPELYVGNTAIFGVYLKSSIALEASRDGGDMMASIAASFGRAMDLSRYYDSTSWIASTCSIQPMYQRVGMTNPTLYVLAANPYFGFASTAISFDLTQINSANGGMASPSPMYTFDVTASSTPPFTTAITTASRQILNDGATGKLSLLKWMWAATTTLSTNVLTQSSVIASSSKTSGIIQQTKMIDCTDQCVDMLIRVGVYPSNAATVPCIASASHVCVGVTNPTSSSPIWSYDTGYGPQSVRMKHMCLDRTSIGIHPLLSIGYATEYGLAIINGCMATTMLCLRVGRSSQLCDRQVQIPISRYYATVGTDHGYVIVPFWIPLLAAA
jgi:hypothetical protein